jgi:hypothetical protein
MNRQELQSILRAEGIRSDAYDLEGGHLNECYVLANYDPIWSVYYSERGQEIDLRQFSSEEEACEYQLKLLRDDPTTKARN